MACRFSELVVNSRDPEALAAFWAAVLDYRVLFALIGVATLFAGGYLWHGRTLSPPPSARIPAPRRPADGPVLADRA